MGVNWQTFFASLVLSLGLLALSATQAARQAVPVLYDIATGESRGVLIGTIHLPHPKLTRLDWASAIEGSERLYTEVPFDENSQAEALAGSLIQGPETLVTLLKPETLKRLEAALPVPLYPMLKLKPWAVMTSLLLLPDTLAFPGHQPPDVIVSELAKARRIPTDSLETISEQLAAFDTFSLQEQILMLEATLNEFEQAQTDNSPTAELLEAYLTGNLTAIAEIMAEPTESLDEALKERFLDVLLRQRDTRMAERIVAEMQEHAGKRLAFAVGAAHLLPDGIPAKLEALGVSVKRRE